ncbi:MAG: ParA family protein, partial [Leptolyngbya sp. SIO4C5]|nr:ParA family protein [Leptolyngbya sp. SIO4C5]
LPPQSHTSAAAGGFALQQRWYDFVVVDTKAHPDPEDIRVLADNCDLLILPSRPTFLDLHALLQTVQALEKLQAAYRVLLTMVRPPKRTDKHTRRMTAREFLAKEGIPVFATEIQQLVVFEEAPDHGALVKDVPGAMAQKAWSSYQALGAEIKQEMGW